MTIHGEILVFFFYLRIWFRIQQELIKDNQKQNHDDEVSGGEKEMIRNPLTNISAKMKWITEEKKDCICRFDKQS